MINTDRYDVRGALQSPLDSDRSQYHDHRSIYNTAPYNSSNTLYNNTYTDYTHNPHNTHTSLNPPSSPWTPGTLSSAYLAPNLVPPQPQLPYRSVHSSIQLIGKSTPRGATLNTDNPEVRQILSSIVASAEDNADLSDPTSVSSAVRLLLLVKGWLRDKRFRPEGCDGAGAGGGAQLLRGVDEASLTARQVRVQQHRVMTKSARFYHFLHTADHPPPITHHLTSPHPRLLSILLS